VSEVVGPSAVAAGASFVGPRGLARQSAVLGAATILANLLGYAFAVVLSRALGPDGYGALASLLALGVIGSIPAVALQLLVAREVASTGTGAAVWIKTSLLIGLALMVLFWVLAPFARNFLGLASSFPVIWLGVSLLPTTITGSLQGLLLGRKRYGELGGSYLLLAGLRFAGGCIAAAIGASVSGALAAATAGTAFACLLIWRIAAPRDPARQTAVEEQVDLPGIRVRVQSLVAAASVTAAILLLTNLDVILARHFLSGVDSGHYGAGSLFAKAAFWAPNFLAVLAFPLLANRESRRRSLAISTALTLAIGSVVVLGVILFAGLIIDATVGPAYADVAGLAGQFALLGVLAALLQLLLYSGLARRGRQAETLVWAGIAIEVLVVSAWFHGSAQQILAASILVCTVVSLAVAASEIRASTRSTIDVG
jgi:O-antigen/teichoic acid export membrane protein